MIGNILKIVYISKFSDSAAKTADLFRKTEKNSTVYRVCMTELFVRKRLPSVKLAECLIDRLLD